MDSFTDPNKDVGSFNYPHLRNFPKNKYRFHFENSEDSEFMHIVVGHSQIRDKWEVPMTGELNYPMNWISFSGGKAEFLGDEIIRILNSNDHIQLRISAIIWQNSIESSTAEDLKRIALAISDEIAKHPQHKVAFPSLHFVPQQQQFWDKIGHFNNFLRDLNIKNGLNPYNLHKTTMRKVKGKGMKVTQTSWKEFNNNKGKGYHIDSHVNVRYVKFIKTYHLRGFKDKESGGSKVPNSTDSMKHLFPSQLMRHPTERDVREILNDIKSVKRKSYGDVKVEDELFLIREERDSLLKKAREEIKQSNKIIDVTCKQKNQLKDMQARLDEWEKSSRAREKELIKHEREMDAKEKDLECREAELELREQKFKEQLEELGCREVKLDLKIVQMELEIAQLQNKSKKEKRNRKEKKRCGERKKGRKEKRREKNTERY